MKSTPQSLATRQKIALKKQKISNADLIQAATDYLNKYAQSSAGFPTIAELARHIGITQSTLKDRATTLPDLTRIIEIIRDRQEHLLIRGGLNGSYNSNFAQFLLKSKHNYADLPTQLTQNNNFTISADVLAEALKLTNSK